MAENSGRTNIACHAAWYVVTAIYNIPLLSVPPNHILPSLPRCLYPDLETWTAQSSWRMADTSTLFDRRYLTNTSSPSTPFPLCAPNTCSFSPSSCLEVYFYAIHLECGFKHSRRRCPVSQTLFFLHFHHTLLPCLRSRYRTVACSATSFDGDSRPTFLRAGGRLLRRAVRGQHTSCRRLRSSSPASSSSTPSCLDDLHAYPVVCHRWVSAYTRPSGRVASDSVLVLTHAIHPPQTSQAKTRTADYPLFLCQSLSQPHRNNFRDQENSSESEFVSPSCKPSSEPFHLRQLSIYIAVYLHREHA